MWFIASALQSIAFDQRPRSEQDFLSQSLVFFIANTHPYPPLWSEHLSAVVCHTVVGLEASRRGRDLDPICDSHIPTATHSLLAFLFGSVAFGVLKMTGLRFIFPITITFPPSCKASPSFLRRISAFSLSFVFRRPRARLPPFRDPLRFDLVLSPSLPFPHHRFRTFATLKDSIVFLPVLVSFSPSMWTRTCLAETLCGQGCSCVMAQKGRETAHLMLPVLLLRSKMLTLPNFILQCRVARRPLSSAALSPLLPERSQLTSAAGAKTYRCFVGLRNVPFRLKACGGRIMGTKLGWCVLRSSISYLDIAVLVFPFSFIACGFILIYLILRSVSLSARSIVHHLDLIL